MPQASDMSKYVVALLVAAVITGIASIPGTAWSGFARPGLLFFGIFAGMLLLMHLLDNAAQDALSGPAPKKASHKKG